MTRVLLTRNHRSADPERDTAREDHLPVHTLARAFGEAVLDNFDDFDMEIEARPEAGPEAGAEDRENLEEILRELTASHR